MGGSKQTECPCPLRSSGEDSNPHHHAHRYTHSYESYPDIHDKHKQYCTALTGIIHTIDDDDDDDDVINLTRDQEMCPSPPYPQQCCPFAPPMCEKIDETVAFRKKSTLGRPNQARTEKFPHILKFSPQGNQMTGNSKIWFASVALQ